MSDRNDLISVDQLKQKIGNENLVILDGTWHMPNANRNAVEEYNSDHIEGALHFDINAVADQNSGQPHTMPNADLFETSVRAMGVTNQSEIVIYDVAGMFAAARVWWMFKSFGAKNVKLLDGGLPAWKAAGNETTDMKTNTIVGDFVAKFEKGSVTSLADMREQVASGSHQVLDARGAGRFAGSDPEPRAGMRAGHMPGATNVPFPSLLNEDGTFRSNEELSTLFSSKLSAEGKDITASCGSGVTAAIILFSLNLIGITNTSLYDGSWSEWGSLQDTPIVTD